MHRTTPRRLGVGVGLALVLVLVSAGVAHHNLSRFAAVSQEAELTRAMLAALHKSFSAVQEAEAGQHGFLITGDDRFLEPYVSALAKLGTELADLRRLAGERPAYGPQVARYESAIDATLGGLERTIALAHTAGLDAARGLVSAGEGRARMDEVRRLSAGLEISALGRLERDRRALADGTRRAVTTIALATAVNVGLLVGIFVVVRRYLRDRAAGEASIRALNRDLESHAREVELANAELESFSYSVSHDLRAPLRSIDGFSRILEEDAAPRLAPADRDALARVRAACGRMSRLIDALLSLSRLTRRELRPGPVDLAEIARTVVADLAPDLEGRDVRVEIPGELPAHGDPDLLRVVLDNLLRNAVKFTRGRAEARIAVGMATSPEGVPTYYVQDNGAGFDMAYAHKLFRPFERLVTDVEGTGIGLATVQRAVARHGGRAWADATAGAGATFYFTLSKT